MAQEAGLPSGITHLWERHYDPPASRPGMVHALHYVASRYRLVEPSVASLRTVARGEYRWQGGDTGHRQRQSRAYLQVQGVADLPNDYRGVKASLLLAAI
jgi:hypothetical protein